MVAFSIPASDGIHVFRVPLERTLVSELVCEMCPDGDGDVLPFPPDVVSVAAMRTLVDFMQRRKSPLECMCTGGVQEMCDVIKAATFFGIQPLIDTGEMLLAEYLRTGAVVLEQPTTTEILGLYESGLVTLQK